MALCVGLHIDGRIKTQGKKKYQTAFVKRERRDREGAFDDVVMETAIFLYTNL